MTKYKLSYHDTSTYYDPKNHHKRESYYLTEYLIDAIEEARAYKTDSEYCNIINTETCEIAATVYQDGSFNRFENYKNDEFKQPHEIHEELIEMIEESPFAKITVVDSEDEQPEFTELEKDLLNQCDDWHVNVEQALNEIEALIDALKNHGEKGFATLLEYSIQDLQMLLKIYGG